MHGGATPSGIASANYRHGRYSRCLPVALAEKFETAIADETLLSVSAEIGTVTARIAQLYEQIAAEESPKKLASLWRSVGAEIDRRSRLCEAEAKRLVLLGSWIPADRAEAMIRAVGASVRQHVSDRETLAKIAADVQRILSKGE